MILKTTMGSALQRRSNANAVARRSDPLPLQGTLPPSPDVVAGFRRYVALFELVGSARAPEGSQEIRS
jgi:hypothetical protein